MFCLRLVATSATLRELAPRSKRLTCKPTASTPSASCQSSAMILSSSVLAWSSFVLSSIELKFGSGNALRSVFPLGVSGIASRKDIDRRNHVLRQFLPRVNLQFLRADSQTKFGNDVCDQLRVVGPIASNNHYRFVHRGMGAQNRLNFAELDPEAANLYLLIGSANKLDLAVVAVPGEITRPVEYLRAARVQMY